MYIILRNNLGVGGLGVKLSPIPTLRLKNTILWRMVLEGKAKPTGGEEDLAVFLWEPVFQGRQGRKGISVCPVVDTDSWVTAHRRPARQSSGHQHRLCWVFHSFHLSLGVLGSQFSKCVVQGLWQNLRLSQGTCETNIIFKITLSCYFCFYFACITLILLQAYRRVFQRLISLQIECRSRCENPTVFY